MPEFGDYTAATSLGDTDLMVILQSSATKKITGANMKASVIAAADLLYAEIDHNHAGTYQPLDADLTAIAGLSPSNDDVLQRKAGGWTNRTIAQLKTDLSLSGTNTGDQDLSGYALLGHNHSGTYEPADADLTAIAGLSASNDDFLQRKAGAWANRTIAQVKTDLGLSGTNSGDQTISDATISTTDITTNNVSISKHGFAPKLPNDATKYLDGTGAYTVPAGGGGGTPGGSDTQLQRNNAGAFGGVSGATSDGTNVVYGSGNLRATSPRFTTGILDANGNSMLAFSPTASAVDSFTFTNAATGSPLLDIAATGSDTNIGISLTAKGSGGSLRLWSGALYTSGDVRMMNSASDISGPFDTFYFRNAGSGGGNYMSIWKGQINFTVASNAENGIDLGIGRNAADVAEINNGTPGTIRDLRLRKLFDANGVQVVTAQGAAVADATGAGDVVAQLNTLLARCRAHGLIAT